MHCCPFPEAAGHRPTYQRLSCSEANRKRAHTSRCRPFPSASPRSRRRARPRFFCNLFENQSNGLDYSMPEPGPKISPGQSWVANHTRRGIASEIEVGILPINGLMLWIRHLIHADCLGSQIERDRGGKTIGVTTGVGWISYPAPDLAIREGGQEGSSLACVTFVEALHRAF